MATTTYNVFAGDDNVGTKSKKATAIEFAKAKLAELRVPVRVETSTGNVVFEQKVRKQQIKTPRYSRTVTLPEGTRVPDGFRVAYDRRRKGIFIVHNAETGEYRVVNGKGKALAKGLTTTREAGAFCKTVPLPEKELASA